MKYASLIALLLLVSCSRSDRVSSIQQDSQQSEAPVEVKPKRPDHIFVVWFENKAYSQIIGSPSAPYINSLISKGTLFSKSYALFHPSYPNYVAFFAGSNYGVINDSCINGASRNYKTMYNSLCSANASFRWFSEDLPAIGDKTCRSGHYVERHNPTTIFLTVPASASVSLRRMNLTDTTKYKGLPTVACITPNLMNDMHDGPITQGDAWLKTNFSALIDWCLQHNSIFIVYFDEDNKKDDNRIPVIMVGEHIRANHVDTTYHDHYSFTKSILHWRGADSTFTTNLAKAKVIRNIWR